MSHAVHPSELVSTDEQFRTTHWTVPFKRVNWGAVFAGAVFAIGLQVILTVLGIALGVSIADDATSQTVGIVAGLWWLITGTISLFVGGAIVGWMVGIPRSGELAVHSFAMWALTAIFGFMLLWSSTQMAVNAAGPWAVMQQQQGQPDMSATNYAGTSSTAPAASPNITAAEQEAARQAARNASWWALVGLLLGVTATLGGTWLSTAHYHNDHDRNARTYASLPN